MNISKLLGVSILAVSSTFAQAAVVPEASAIAFADFAADAKLVNFDVFRTVGQDAFGSVTTQFTQSDGISFEGWRTYNREPAVQGLRNQAILGANFFPVGRTFPTVDVAFSFTAPVTQFGFDYWSPDALGMNLVLFRGASNVGSVSFDTGGTSMSFAGAFDQYGFDRVEIDLTPLVPGLPVPAIVADQFRFSAAGLTAFPNIDQLPPDLGVTAPVPEPGTNAMLAVGLIGVLLRLRRRAPL